VLPFRRAAVGVNVATSPEYVTAPATATPPGATTVKVVVVIEAGLIAMLNVAVTVVSVATPEAL
jgi:hypothetical protein